MASQHLNGFNEGCLPEKRSFSATVVPPHAEFVSHKLGEIPLTTSSLYRDTFLLLLLFDLLFILILET